MARSGPGQIYRIHRSTVDARDEIARLKGITQGEAGALITIVSLASRQPNLTTCERDVLENMQDRGHKISRARLIGWITTLTRFDVFVRDEIVRRGTKPAARYTLVDPLDLINSPALLDRQVQLNAGISDGPNTNPIIDPSIDALEGITDSRVAYSRKIDNLLLRRVSSNPADLGQPIELTLPGMGEKVTVVQRTLTGIPGMDGSETRLQQALLTMFKKNIELERTRRTVTLETIPRRWRVDLNEVCKTMGLVPSSGNMLSQARALQRLAANEFLIIFQEGSKAAARFGHTEEDVAEVRMNEDGRLERRVDSLQRSERFIDFIEPVLFEEINPPEQSELPLDHQPAKPTPVALSSRSSEDLAIFDRHGKLYRFWNLSFGERIHHECVQEALGYPQIFTQPGSLLKEDSIVVRGLVSLAQRSLSRRNRLGTFEESWGAIAHEIRPLVDPITTMRSIRDIFISTYAKQNQGMPWNPTFQDEDVVPCPISLHGYLMEAIVPPRSRNRRSDWKLRMCIDPSDSVIGERGIATEYMFDRDERLEHARIQLERAKQGLIGRPKSDDPEITS